MSNQDRWNLLIMATFIVCVLVMVVVTGRASAGIPGGFGFPPSDLPAFWVGFWSGGIPTLLAGGVLATVVGVFLSSRDRDFYERQERQRSADRLAVFQPSLVHAAQLPWHAVLTGTLAGTMPPSARQSWELIERQPIGELRRHVLGEDAFFAEIDRFRSSYSYHERFLYGLDSRLDFVIPQAILDFSILRLPLKVNNKVIDNVAHYFTFPLSESRFMKYIVGIFLRMDTARLDLELNLDETEKMLFPLLWQFIADNPEISVLIDRYRREREAIIGATETLAQTCSWQDNSLPSATIKVGHSSF